MGFPPLEAREDSLRALGRVDLFGTGVNPQQMDRMRHLEVQRYRWMIFAAGFTDTMIYLPSQSTRCGRTHPSASDGTTSVHNSWRHGDPSVGLSQGRVGPCRPQ